MFPCQLTLNINRTGWWYSKSTWRNITHTRARKKHFTQNTQENKFQRVVAERQSSRRRMFPLASSELLTVIGGLPRQGTFGS